MRVSSFSTTLSTLVIFHFYVFLKIFVLWTIFKVFIEFVIILLVLGLVFLAARHVRS